MNRILPVSLCLGVLAAASVLAADGAMTRAERDYLLAQLKSSKAGMVASIKGLTQAQWTFKPSPEAWSVQECAEHIILSEAYIFDASQKVLTTPTAARLASATADDDRRLVARIEDRSNKAKAPEPLVPSDKFPTPQSAIQEFTTRRDKTIAYVKTTQDPLRVHVGPSPAGGQFDSYQMLLLLSSHSVRHTSQIKEVEANSGFPKAKTKATN
jgi:DinB superfamily